jgi:putative transposase
MPLRSTVPHVGKQRLEVAGGIYHVVTRGNARAEIFLEEVDYVLFLQRLARAVERRGLVCLAYCLLPNHYHLLLETPEPNLSAGMLVLNGSYARTFNWRHKRTGHVFEGPYFAELIETDEHLMEACRYVALNPVRAGLCRHPEDWRWSSHRATAGLEHYPPYLSADRVRRLFGSAERYRSFVAALAEPCNQVA